MKVLYICHDSYSYDNLIVNCIVSEYKHKVTTFKIPTSKLFFKMLSQRLDQQYSKKILNKLNEFSDYDFILLRGGRTLSKEYLINLRKNNPRAKFVNYHWDSIRPAYQYFHLVEFFDKVFTFERKDAEQYNFEYLPLFFIDKYKQVRTRTSLMKYDIVFVAAWRDYERVQFVSKIENFCAINNLMFKHYLHLPLRRVCSLLIKTGGLPRKFKLASLSHDQIARMFSCSKVVIDFPSSFQTGLTMRTFETLGSGSKLITTNREIVKEPFYDENMVQVIDREKLNIDPSFIKKEVATDDFLKKIENYTLENFVSKLLSIN